MDEWLFCDALETQWNAKKHVHRQVILSWVIALLQVMHAPIITEPEVVYPEFAFESAITEAVHALLDGSDSAVVVPRLGLDIAVFGGGAVGS